MFAFLLPKCLHIHPVETGSLEDTLYVEDRSFFAHRYCKSFPQCELGELVSFHKTFWLYISCSDISPLTDGF